MTKHCAANGARTVAVAVNFSDRVSRLPSAVLLLVVPASRSVIQTDFLLQGGSLGLVQSISKFKTLGVNLIGFLITQCWVT